MTSLYQALNPARREIRLLRLAADNNTKAEHIDCELATVALVDEPTYAALSYCWGDEVATHAITVNGQPFLVRPNLFAYLQLQQQDHDYGWLYVDAVCINQQDIDERSSQVGFMGDVFRGAETVIAWLGPIRDANPSDLSPAQELFDWMYAKYERGGDDESSQLHEEATQCQPEGEPSHVFRRIGVELFGAQYWTRIWVVQEVIVARKLVVRTQVWELSEGVLWKFLRLWLCDMGFRSPGTDPFFMGVLNLPQTGGSHSPWLNATSIMHMRLKVKASSSSHQQGMRFSEALNMFLGHACSERHDKVFALLGMCSATHVPVDYRLNTFELFARALLAGMFEIIHAEHAGDLSPAEASDQMLMFHWATHVALDIAPVEPTALLISQLVFTRLGLAGSSGMAILEAAVILDEDEPFNNKSTGSWIHQLYRTVTRPLLPAYYRARWQAVYPQMGPERACPSPLAPLFEAALRYGTTPAPDTDYLRWVSIVDNANERTWNSTDVAARQAMSPAQPALHQENLLKYH